MSVSLMIAFALYFTMIEDFFVWISVVRMLIHRTPDQVIIAKILKPKSMAIRIEGNSETKLEMVEDIYCLAFTMC